MIEYSECGCDRPIDDVKQKVKYKAVDYANHRFYIAETVFDSAMIQALNMHNECSEMILMRVASYAVFIPENKLVKCRTTLTDLLDSALVKQ